MTKAIVKIAHHYWQQSYSFTQEPRMEKYLNRIKKRDQWIQDEPLLKETDQLFLERQKNLKNA